VCRSFWHQTTGACFRRQKQVPEDGQCVVNFRKAQWNIPMVRSDGNSKLKSGLKHVRYSSMKRQSANSSAELIHFTGTAAGRSYIHRVHTNNTSLLHARWNINTELLNSTGRSHKQHSMWDRTPVQKCSHKTMFFWSVFFSILPKCLLLLLCMHISLTFHKVVQRRIRGVVWWDM